MATCNGNTECLDILLQAGADVDKTRDEQGYTPLHRAADEHRLECLKLLLTKGASVNSLTRIRMSPWFIAGLRQGSDECQELLRKVACQRQAAKMLSGRSKTRSGLCLTKARLKRTAKWGGNLQSVVRRGKGTLEMICLFQQDCLPN
eukprot:TRINITY_DN11070_c0_g1_i1.p1 TRINITY_DN11070_c0_g1~~TRINITY_DN11070_c0_g1_i1.p1  ORF type:complete len:147 (+),score=5.08 TRINITY_DN11070_c0_g1_i1:526-966(+)